MTRKIVQTVLEEAEYKEFRKASAKAKKSLREAAREAIQRWTEETAGISPDDPIFAIKPVSYGTSRASERHEKILYC